MAAPLETDGRKARRDRNRAAVIDAMIALVFERAEVPSTDDVADRAGVSLSSVFRYFDNLDDLRQQAVATYFERYGSLFEVAELGLGSLDERIARFVDARATLHASVAPIARVARAPRSDGVIGERLAMIRASFAAQVRTHFAGELAACDTDDVADAIDALTSFEAWDLLHTAHGRTDGRIRRMWTTAIRSLLVAPGNGDDPRCRDDR